MEFTVENDIRQIKNEGIGLNVSSDDVFQTM